MPWIPNHELHTCDLPKYDPKDPHFIRDHWQCPYSTCHRLWVVVAVSTQLGDDQLTTGSYRFNPVINPYYA